MKIKPIKASGIYEQSRFNDMVFGTHVVVTRGHISEEKKDFAMLSLYSLMYECGFLSPFTGEYKNKELIEKLSSASEKLVEEYSSNGKMGL